KVVELTVHLEGRTRVLYTPLIPVDVALLDGLSRPLQMSARGHGSDPEPFGLGDELLEALDLVHRPLDNLMPLRVQQALLQVPSQPVDRLEVVRGGGVLGVRTILFEFLLVEAEGHAFLNHGQERADDRTEMPLAVQVDFFG